MAREVTEARGSRPEGRGRFRPSEIVPMWSLAGRRRLHEQLSAMPVLASCSRQQILRVARWGDVIEVQPGEVLAREDRSNHWFFVVLSGSVKVTHRGREVAALGRGGHFGEIAVIGFRPQPSTVVAAEPTVLFVLGRRYLLSLAVSEVAIQRALFPEVEPGAYRAFVREMHAQGQVEWKQLTSERTFAKDLASGPARTRPPGRRLSWAEALELLTHHRPEPEGEAGDGSEDAPYMSGRTVAAALAVVVSVVLAAVLLLYHPPVAVATAARSIDVVEDIQIAGAAVNGPTGRYLLTSVNVSRPNLAGTLAAWVRGRTVVSIRSPAGRLDPAAERRSVREAFFDSHQLAIELAEQALGVDPAGIAVVIRDREIGGSSAGLVYALAILDMLDPGDLAAGRVIAATGELRSDGVVGSVAFVPVKAEVARRGGAEVFLVPAHQEAEARLAGLTVVGVSDLEEAVRILRGET